MTYATLEELCRRAKELSEQDQTDNALAHQISVAATERFGVDCRSRAFIEILQLSNKLREKEVKKWEEKSEIVCVGPIRAEQQPGYFSMTHYALGKSDLFLNGSCVNRMYALLVRLEKEDLLSTLPREYQLRILPERVSKAKKWRVDRIIMDLTAELGRAKPGRYGYGGIVDEAEEPTDAEMSVCFTPGNHIYDMDCTPPGIDRFVHEHIEEFGHFVASLSQNIHQVGSVRDGSKRYHR